MERRKSVKELEKIWSADPKDDSDGGLTTPES